MDERNLDPGMTPSRAGALQAQGKSDEAIDVFRNAAEGQDPRVAARSSVKLAELDPERAEEYYRKAVAAEEKGSGPGSPRVAVVLYAYASGIARSQSRSGSRALLRRALAILQAAPDRTRGSPSTFSTRSATCVEGRRQLDEAEKLIRAAMALAEEKFGPESAQLATSCTYLADVLWNKKSLREAGLLFRRAITIDASLYGPDRPETAADIANLGMVMTEAGQSEAGTALLRQALAIYENTLGPSSEEARFVRGHLARTT